MPEKYAPRHRDEPPRHLQRRAKTGAQNVVLYSGVAVLATSLSVGVGINQFSGSSDQPEVTLSGAPTQPDAAQAASAAAEQADRAPRVSRASTDRLKQAATLKAAELGTGEAPAVTRTETISVSDPKSLARALMPQYGLSSAEFDCLDNIWTQESNWNPRADNPNSSAYGIPQALPGSKMASAGADWETNAETQIRWGLGYIADRYGTACSAWSFKKARGYY